MNAIPNSQARLITMKNSTYCLSVLKLDPRLEKVSMQSGLKLCELNGGAISGVSAS
jgi:hypothetical protein